MQATPDTIPMGLGGYGVIFPKVAACRRNLGLWDAIPLGLKKDSGRRPSGSNRVNRGGSWNNNANNTRCANRNNNNPSNNNNNIGFRIARSSDQRCRMAPP